MMWSKSILVGGALSVTTLVMTGCPAPNPTPDPTPDPVPADVVAAALLDDFGTADTSNDSILSLAEASTAYSGLTVAQFNEIDVNGDFSLDRAELFAAQNATRGTTSYTVTVQNLSNQPLGPIVAATHPDTVAMWRVGANASAGIQTVAEMGNPAPLFEEVSTELTNGNITDAWNTGRPLTRMGVTQPAFGPFAPGAALIDNVTFQITGSPGDVFSCASMVIITNDGFWGVDGVGLPAEGEKTFYAFAYDSGTEENSELASDLDDGGSVLAANPIPNDDTDPAVNDNGGTVTEPRGTIQLHGGILGGGDLDPAIFGWEEPIAVITIRRDTTIETSPATNEGALRTYEVSVENRSNQPLGPLVAATHPADTVLWRVNGDASTGIQTVAEMGNPAPLFGEVTALFDAGSATAIHNTGRPLTRQGVTQPAFGPFAPGADLVDNVTFEIQGRPGELLSCASMVIITNDGFWGLDGVGLPATGSKRMYCFAYDSGTEENTELAEHLDDGGSVLAAEPIPNDDTNPEVNDNGGTATDPRGTISLHPGIVGGGDLDPATFDWAEPIAVVTVTVVE